jgi:hypothetical protein
MRRVRACVRLPSPSKWRWGICSFGLVCAAYSLLHGAKVPVQIDEADMVAGH